MFNTKWKPELSDCGYDMRPLSFDKSGLFEFSKFSQDFLPESGPRAICGGIWCGWCESWVNSRERSVLIDHLKTKTHQNKRQKLVDAGELSALPPRMSDEKSKYLDSDYLEFS